MPELLTVPEIAKMCHVHEATIRRHIRAGKLKSVHVGRSVRVRREDLDAYVGQKSDDYIELKPFKMTDSFRKLIGMGEVPPGDEWVSGDKHRALAEIAMAEFDAVP